MRHRYLQIPDKLCISGVESRLLFVERGRVSSDEFYISGKIIGDGNFTFFEISCLNLTEDIVRILQNRLMTEHHEIMKSVNWVNGLSCAFASEYHYKIVNGGIKSTAFNLLHLNKERELCAIKE